MSSPTANPLLPFTHRRAAKRLWITSSILGFVLAVWFFYPVEVYRGYIPTYLSVVDFRGKTDFAGVVKVTRCEHPILAAIELRSRSSPRFSSQALQGGRGYAHWSVHPGGHSPGTLSWRIKNLVWTLEPADPFGSHARGSPEWIEAMTESADLAIASFQDGTLKSSQVEAGRTSLGVILLERGVERLRLFWRRW